MEEVRSALLQRLSGESSIVSAVATYADGPAIFTGGLVPADAVFPYVHVAGPVGGGNLAGKSHNRTDVFFDVGIFSDDPESAAAVEAVAWAIRRALHRRPLALGSAKNVVAEAGVPTLAPTSENVVGMTVGLRLILSAEEAV
jgi:hypothetical protein